MPTSRRVELPDGTIYDGELDDEFLFHGKGVLKMKDGGEYTMWWEKGAHHGEGKLTLPSGYSYDGHWLHGKKSGHGVMTDDAGRRYEGEWHDGRQHAIGRMMYTNGDEYSGKWRAGVPHGKGQLTNKGGAVAVGVDRRQAADALAQGAGDAAVESIGPAAAPSHALRPARAPHDDGAYCKELDRAVRSVLSRLDLNELNAQHGAPRADVHASRKRFLTHARHQ